MIVAVAVVQSTDGTGIREQILIKKVIADEKVRRNSRAL
jgi:hypothetical protein